MTLGSRVAVLRHGRLQQEAAPDTLYAAPANMFVAAFIGSPPMNLVEGEIGGGFDATMRVGRTVIALDPEETRDAAHAAGRSVVAGIRPERMALAAESAPADDRTLTGTVRYRESFGSDVMVQMALPASRPLHPDLFALAHDVEDSVELDGPETKADAAILQVRLPAGAPVKVGAPLRVALAPRSVVLFDPKTGERIAADRSEGADGARKAPQ